jgi:uncharacterized protein YcnI
MTRTIALCAVLSLALPVGALAHVGIRPAESTPASEERYTVRVPTEGAVATASVHLEIPDGVTVMEIDAVEGGSATAERRDGRIVGITWTKAIPPKQSAEFTFRARNPETGTAIAWKAHQHFVDGSVTAWVEPAGGARPGPVTRLVAGAAATPAR